MSGEMDVTERRQSNSFRHKRKLTPFLCRELLYEYVAGTLDSIRKADIDEYLPTDKSSQDALEAIRRGLEYADKLAASEISPELMARLSESENVGSIARRYTDWYEWPEMVRWSITALALSVLISGVVAIVPWNRLPSLPKKKNTHTVVLTDIPGATVASQDAETIEDAGADAGEEAPAAAEVETSGDEHITGDEPAAPSPPAKTAALAPPAAEPSAPRPTPPATKPSAPTPMTAAAAATEIAATEAATRELKPKGFVYRAFMSVADVDETTPDVVSRLESFGAEKAGEVQLGWRRGAGSYFHFTVPESNENQVLEILRTYGPVRISKDPHPRVMPSGQVRFILWIEPQQGD